MEKVIWKDMRDALELLLQLLSDLGLLLAKDKEEHRRRRAEESIATDTWAIEILNNNRNDAYPVHFAKIQEFMKEKECYSMERVNNVLPESSLLRYRVLNSMKTKGIFIRLGVRLVLCTRSYGNNTESLHYGWLIDAENVDPEQQGRLQELCRKDVPVYHSRVMKRKFMEVAESLDINNRAKLRKLYQVATGDSSAAPSLDQAAVDERLDRFLELGDPTIIVDMRNFNKRPACFDAFFEATEKYIEQQVQTAVDDRRHDQVVHLATAMSVADLHR